MSLLPVLFQWPLNLLLVQVAFLHLIEPACSVVVEAEGEEADEASPVQTGEKLLTRGSWLDKDAAGSNTFLSLFPIREGNDDGPAIRPRPIALEVATPYPHLETERLTREDAYMLVSVAMDLVVTRVVDLTKGIHALMPKALFQR